MILLEYQPVLRNTAIWLENWMLILGLLVLALLAWVRVNYPRRIRELALSVTNERMLKQNMREEYLFSHRASMVFIVIFGLVGGLLLYLIDQITYIDLFGLEGIWKSLSYGGLLLALLFLKMTFLRIIQSLGDGNFGLKAYRYHSFLSYMLTGIVWIPIVLLSLFLPIHSAGYLLALASIIYGLSYLFKVWRGWQEARLEGTPLHYIILYLCTFEILPLMIGWKWLSALNA